ncbi:MAG: hypothetical protein JRJ15_15900, partial [Deltaproteobacteria bacterium]|nr:hypothetical protein [Deltaproteobacteria bacterium]
IGLSIRKLEESSEKDVFKSYLDNPQEATSNLGALLREEMMNLQQQEASPEGIESQESEASEEASGEISDPGPQVRAEDTSSEKATSEETSSEGMESQEAEASEEASEEVSDPGPQVRAEDTSSEKATSEETSSEGMEPQEAEASEEASEEGSDPDPQVRAEDTSSEKATSEETSSETKTRPPLELLP